MDSKELIAAARRRAATLTFARLEAARTQYLSPNKGQKQLAAEIFARLEAERLKGT
jgi:hypothetical protein